MSHAEAIQRNIDVLLRCTTINLHVIDFLRAEDVLDEAQEHKLKTRKNPLKKRILLFQWLKGVPCEKYESFLQVMKDAEQEHVANLLTGSTEDDYLPLSDEKYTRLVKIRHKMAYVTRIDNEVIAELRSLKAISMTDAEEIRAETVDYAKISKLISAVMRRSNHSFNSLQEVLRKTLQTAAAEFLNEGEMPALHINNNRPDLDGPLSRSFNHVIRNRTTDDENIRELLAEMNGLGLNLVAAVPGQSIVVFIYCKTVHSAVNFTQLFNSGRLQQILERIFNRLLLTIEPHNTLNSRINLEDKEVVNLEGFTGIEGWMIEGFNGQRPSGEIYGCDATTQTAGNKDQTLGQTLEENSRLMNLSETKQKENEKLMKLLETKQKENEKLMKLLETKQKENEKLVKLLEHQTRTDEFPAKYKSDPVLVRTIRTKVADKPKSIRGFAILDKELFVAIDWSSKVEVYDSMDFSFSRRWNLSELICPEDIGSCNINKCLYIMDNKDVGQSKEILRVHPSGQLIKKWSTGYEYGSGLSVTGETNIIVAVEWKNKLSEYSSDGQLIREIILSPEAGLCQPMHAIKLTNGYFMVSHGYLENLFTVSVVDADGKFKKSFCVTCRSIIGEINYPVYLSVDGNGFVMVIDRGNSRVLILDSDLEFKREILSKEKHRLRRPERILLDESNGRLFVADNEWNEGHLLIFQLK